MSVRRMVAKRAGNRCEYCLSPESFSIDSFTIDHIIPSLTEDRDAPDNLAYSCHNCNNRKQDDIVALDPSTNVPVPLYHPRHDKWPEHFVWSPDLLTLIPLSPTGRATISRLHLNRIGAVNIRRALIALND